jgi:two-component system, LytTR family, sensor histidine kinase AlgZ
MNSMIESKKLNESCGPEPNAGIGPHLLRALVIIFGATLLIFLIFSSVGFYKLSETVQRLFEIFVYSACIALPSIFFATYVSVRYTERFPRAIFVIQAGCFVCTATAGSFAAVVIFCIAGTFPRAALWGEFHSSLPFSIVITLAIGLSISTYQTLQYKLHAAEIELRTRQMEQERAYKLLAEARLSSLESSIHPHFLFNTLNSIAALIPTNPQRAEDIVGKLASLLRFSLNAQHGGLVTLGQELKIVRDYLEIEATRFGPRLRYEVLIPASLESIKAPPLALQTLVENAVKHVAAQRTAGATIQVRGTIEAGKARLEVIDDGPGFSLDAATPQHGLGNLAARLELLFGAAGRLDVARENEKTVVRISFPAEV